MSEIYLSIITVCYNCEDELKKTFNSVYRQLDYILCNEIEYIVIDGDSKDNTLNVASTGLQKLHKAGVKTILISEEDGGIYDAMNKGIGNANGKWIYMLNAGDTFNNDLVLSHVLPKMHKLSADVIYGNTLRVNAYYKEIWLPGNIDRIKKNMIVCHQSIFIKRQISGHLYDVQYKYCADYNLVLKLYLAGYKFEYIDEIISNYSLEGITANEAIVLAYKEIYEIRKKNKVLGNAFIEFLLYYIGLGKRHIIKLISPELRGKIKKRIFIK